ncbi:hypothetical protein chiPu_0002372, partial [Chiloscyllium punctatum]|nr:hypothetical protein [Chiloscyllium punctatum]
GNNTEGETNLRKMPQLNSGGGDDLGANDEMISFKDEGEQEEKASENALTERDLADVKSSLVSESETNQNVNPASDLGAIRRSQDNQRIYQDKSRGHIDDAYSGYPHFLMLQDPYLSNGSLSPSSNKVPVVQPSHAVHPLTPLISYSNEHFAPSSHSPHLPAEINQKSGLHRSPQGPDLAALYSLSPGTAGQITPTIGWQGQSVYPITSCGFRQPYSSPLPPSTSISRFPHPLVLGPPGMHSTGIPHPAIVSASGKPDMSQYDSGLRSMKPNPEPKREKESKKPTIKKPLNAFMLYMKEMRAKVVAECTLKESAAINQILGRRWHALSREEQAKYYELARKERQLHMQLYPGWSARDNYVVTPRVSGALSALPSGYSSREGKKKRRKREKQQDSDPDSNTAMMCRPLFELDLQ